MSFCKTHLNTTQQDFACLPQVADQGTAVGLQQLVFNSCLDACPPKFKRRKNKQTDKRQVILLVFRLFIEGMFIYLTVLAASAAVVES